MVGVPATYPLILGTLLRYILFAVRLSATTSRAGQVCREKTARLRAAFDVSPASLFLGRRLLFTDAFAKAFSFDYFTFALQVGIAGRVTDRIFDGSFALSTVPLCVHPELSASITH
jgi:hypothetical protein